MSNMKRGAGFTLDRGHALNHGVKNRTRSLTLPYSVTLPENKPDNEMLQRSFWSFFFRRGKKKKIKGLLEQERKESAVRSARSNVSVCVNSC